MAVGSYGNDSGRGRSGGVDGSSSGSGGGCGSSGGGCGSSGGGCGSSGGGCGSGGGGTSSGSSGGDDAVMVVGLMALAVQRCSVCGVMVLVLSFLLTLIKANMSSR